MEIAEVSGQNLQAPSQTSTSPWLLCSQSCRSSPGSQQRAGSRCLPARTRLAPLPAVLTTLKHRLDVQVAAQEEVWLPLQSLQGTQTGRINTTLQGQPGRLLGSRRPRQPLPGRTLTWAQTANSRFTQYRRKPSLFPPKQCQPSIQAVRNTWGALTPRPEDRCQGGVRTNAPDRGQDSCPRGSTPGRWQPRQAQQRIPLAQSSPLEDAGAPGVTATGPCSGPCFGCPQLEPTPRSALAARQRRQRDAKIAWQFLAASTRSKKLWFYSAAR